MTNREEMTNRQAIDLLEEVSDCDDSMYAYNPAYMLALDLAISALEFRERYDQFWEEVKAAGTQGKETEILHSGRVFRIREVAQ